MGRLIRFEQDEASSGAFLIHDIWERHIRANARPERRPTPGGIRKLNFRWGFNPN